MPRRSRIWSDDLAPDRIYGISDCIRLMLSQTNIYRADISKVLQRGLPVLRNKLYTNTFSISELVMIADMSGWTLTLTKRGHQTIRLTPEKICDKDQLTRLNAYHAEKAAEKNKFLTEAFDQADPDMLKKAYEEYIAAHPEKFDSK